MNGDGLDKEVFGRAESGRRQHLRAMREEATRLRSRLAWLSAEAAGLHTLGVTRPLGEAERQVLVRIGEESATLRSALDSLRADFESISGPGRQQVAQSQ